MACLFLTSTQLRRSSWVLYILALASSITWAATGKHNPILKTLPCALFAVNAGLRAALGRPGPGLRGSRFAVALSVAFVFHGAGDYLLELTKTCGLCFMLGLASFLVGHALNLVAFTAPGGGDGRGGGDGGDSTATTRTSGNEDVDHSNTTANSSNASPRRAPPARLRLAIPFALYLAGMLAVLYSVGPGSAGTLLRHSAALAAAVPVYALVLGSCPWRVLARRGAFGSESSALWLLVLVGYCTYAVSDTTLAIDRFSHAIPEPARDIVVMATYVEEMR